MSEIPKHARFMVEVDTVKLFDAVVENGQDKIGSRLLELFLSGGGGLLNKVALSAAYGIDVDDTPDPEDARIAELEARILALETVTDEDVMLAASVHAEEWDRWTVLTRSYGDAILRTDDDGENIVIQTVPSGDGLMYAADLRGHAAMRAALTTRRGE